MENTSGKQSQSISLGQSRSYSILLEVLMLLGLGMLGIVLHARLRLGLGIPGHHGVIFMALILAGRTSSKLPWAASISSLGVASLLFFPILGFKDPFIALIYLLPGLTLDIFYRNQLLKTKMWYLVLIGGLAYMSIPLSRLFLHFSLHIPYMSFRHGYLTPILTHFMFGGLGSLTALGIKHLLKKS
ncbi:MAG: hypothetical protein HOA61_18130 [Bacteroidetes bacterium]|nr:hypothetical protein [Cytophagia bacterium]MBT5990844.1 hypothetical protein [Bacteroidota bacterium]MBT6837955.1 hypothetical protein [Bacteroidota bacterium]MBT7828549.1 hypothetical protein [Bacteroidota bacterium]